MGFLGHRKNRRIKQELIKRQVYETTIFGGSIGLQVRALKNKVIGEILAIEDRGKEFRELLPCGGEKDQTCPGERRSGCRPLDGGSP
jgi:hypothetical protein